MKFYNVLKPKFYLQYYKCYVYLEAALLLNSRIFLFHLPRFFCLVAFLGRLKRNSCAKLLQYRNIIELELKIAK